MILQPATTAIVPLSTLSLGVHGALAWAVTLVLAAGCLMLAWYAYARTQPQLHGWRRLVLTTLRACVLFALLLMLIEPVLHLSRSILRPPGVLLLVDSSASMSIENSDGSLREDGAEELRSRAREGLSSRRDDLVLLEGEGSSRLLQSRRSEDGGVAPKYRTEGTNLPELLLSSAQRHLEDNLEAILLLSDGVSTSTDLPSLAGLRVPVYTVAVGDTMGPADLRLDRVRYPALAYRGEDIEISAEVVVDDAREGSAWVRLSGSTGDADSVRVEWPAGGGRVPVSFAVSADSLGLQSHVLSVDELAGEPLAANNAVQVGFEVRKDRLRLVYVESRPTWNAHFLARRAASDPRFEWRAVYRGEDGWRVAGTDSIWTPPQNIRDADEVDAWVIGSLNDLAELSESAPGLVASVRSGAGLLVLFGEPARRSLRPLSSAARDLLPVELEPAARWVQANHRVRPTVMGLGHPVLAFDASLGDVTERLEEMPPLWESVHALHLRDGSDALLQVQAGDKSAPLLALDSFGSGTTASWSAAPLWSWSFWRLGATEGEEIFDALTGNLLYYLAEGGDRSRLRLLLPRAVLAQGEDAALKAVALDQRLQPDDGSDVWLEWFKAGGGGAAPDSTSEPTGRARMDLDTRTPGGRSLPLPALPPGEYHFRVALEEGEDRVTSAWKRLVIDPYSVEYQHPGIDRAALARIAADTGGGVLRPDELRQWASDLSLEEKEATLLSRFELWSSMWFFLPFLLALCLEWILRKRWGLV